MKKQLLRFLTLAAIVCILSSGLCVSAQRPSSYDETGCMSLITDPNGSAQPVIFCRGNDDLTMNDVRWVEDSTRGQVVQFGGVDEYFRIGYNDIQLANFTLSMWVNWQGAAEGGSGEMNQRIFSIRGPYSGKEYLTLSPMETTEEGSDALRLHMRYQNSDWDLCRPQASPLKQNEWHHVAVVSTEETLALYLDGVLMDEELTMMGIVNMRPQQLYIGKGPIQGGDGYFHGMMDDVLLYKHALDVDELNALIAAQTPQPTTPSTEETPTTTTRVDETIPTVPSQVDYSLPLIPNVVWIVVSVVGVLILALIISVNIQYAKEHPTEKKAKIASTDTDPDSIE